MIKKEGNKWVLHSKDGTKRLGEFDSREAAVKREGQIEYFKHVKKSFVEKHRAKLKKAKK